VARTLRGFNVVREPIDEDHRIPHELEFVPATWRGSPYSLGQSNGGTILRSFGAMLGDGAHSRHLIGYTVRDGSIPFAASTSQPGLPKKKPDGDANKGQEHHQENPGPR
jgi:hypothetical protein